MGGGAMHFGDESFQSITYMVLTIKRLHKNEQKTSGFNVVDTIVQCFDAVGWATGRASGL